jgi:hypothetical protein
MFIWTMHDLLVAVILAGCVLFFGLAWLWERWKRGS